MPGVSWRADSMVSWGFFTMFGAVTIERFTGVIRFSCALCYYFPLSSSPPLFSCSFVSGTYSRIHGDLVPEGDEVLGGGAVDAGEGRDDHLQAVDLLLLRRQH